MGRRHCSVVLALLAAGVPAQQAASGMAPTTIRGTIERSQPFSTYRPDEGADSTPVQMRAGFHEVRIVCSGWHTVECASDWFEPVVVVIDGDGTRLAHEVGTNVRVRVRVWVDGPTNLTILVGAREPGSGAYEVSLHHEYLGAVLTRTRLDDARRAFDARIVKLAPDDPAILRAATNYVLQLEQRGMRAVRQQMVELVLARCPPERCVDPEAAKSFLESSGACCLFEDATGGLRLMDRAIAIAAAHPSTDQTRLGMLRRNRALLLFSVDLDRTIVECREALAILSGGPGPAATETLDTTHQLAELLVMKNDWPAAADLCRRALDDSRSATGVDGIRRDLEAVVAFHLVETRSWPEALDILVRLWSGPLRPERTTDESLLRAIAKCVARDSAGDQQIAAAIRWLEERGLLADPAAQMRAAQVAIEVGDAIEAERLVGVVAVGGDDSAAAWAMLWLGGRAMARGDDRAAAAAFAKSNALAERAGSEYPEALQTWSLLLHSKGDLVEATRLMRRALAHYQQTDALDAESCGRVGLQLACLLWESGVPDEALGLFRQAIEVLELHPGSAAKRRLLDCLGGSRDDTAFATMTDALLDAHRGGRTTRARALAAALRDAALVHGFEHDDATKAAHLLRERVVVMDAAPLEFAAAERDLAQCYVLVADMAFGGVLGPWSIAREKVRNLPVAARDIVDSAVVAFSMLLTGEAVPALAEFKRLESRLGSEAPVTYFVVPLLQLQGKYETIETLLADRLANPVATGSSADLVLERVEDLRTLAEAKEWRSDLAGAERCLGDGLELLDELGSSAGTNDEINDAARALRVALAQVRVGQQRFEDAASALGALPIRPDPATADAGARLLRLAESIEEAQLRAAISAGRGDLAAARACLAKAAEQAQPLAGLLDGIAGTPQEQLAHLQADAGDPAAWASFAALAHTSQARLQRRMRVATEAECFDLVEKNRRSLESLIALARRLPASAAQVDDAYRALVAWKGCVFRSIGERRRRDTREASPARSPLLDVIRARVSSAGRDRPGDASAFELSRRQELEQLMAAEAKVDATPVDLPGLDTIAMALPAGSVAIDLFVYEDWQWGRDEAGRMPAFRRSSGQRVGAWCMRSGNVHAIAVDLGPAAELHEAIKNYLDALVPQRGRDPSAPTDKVTAVVALQDRLWAPLAPVVGDAETVFVSPDGFLAEIPFEILQDQDGRFLIEKHAFVYVQDVLSMAAVSRSRARAVAPSLLAVGAVDYDAAPQSIAAASVAAPRSGADEQWIPLSETRREVDAIERTHAVTFGDAVKRLTLRDDVATEERLKRELPAFGVLHLATHGYFDRGRLHDWMTTIRRQGVRSQGGMLPLESGALAGELAGQLSGVVCASANQPAVEGRDDGLLTAGEVEWLNLEQCDLAVLSACQTGLGHAHGGEGLLSLRRAFHSAGAKTVVSSLWKVRDDATKELMVTFYLNMWQRGLGRLAALRAAQLEMLAKNRTRYRDPLPSTWGAFVLSGDWR